jgi:hypothetical protein
MNLECGNYTPPPPTPHHPGDLWAREGMKIMNKTFPTNIKLENIRKIILKL